MLVVPLSVVALIGVSVPSAGAAGPNLLVNGDFETGSTSGWSPVSATLSVASDAHTGNWAASAANNGASTFGLRTTSKPVTNAAAGAQYSANGWLRSDTPGKRVCLVFTEYTSSGSQVAQTKACVTSTSSWAPLATLTREIVNAGDSIALAVRETSAASGDSFEVDDLSMVQETFTPTTVALWHMDETSGPVADSGAAPANNGSLTATGVTRGAAGINGSSAYSFTKGYATVPTDASLNPGTANVNLSLWAAPTSLPTSGDFDMIRKGDSPAQMYKMEVLQSGALLCAFRGTAGSVTVTSATTIALNSGYHHLECVKTANQIKAIIDGNATAKAANIGSISNAAPVVIGAHMGGGDYYKGLIDETSITLG
jgi:Concanavalin A-like lectin/glucanases superfamily